MAQLIEWFRDLTPMGWVSLIIVLLFCVIALMMSYALTRKYTKRNISNRFHDAEIIFPPQSWFVIPSCSTLLTMGIMMYLFELGTDGFYFCIGYLFIIILICSAFKTFSLCNIIKRGQDYFISKSWFGKNFEKISDETIILKYSFYGSIKIYHNSKIYGAISEPRNLPWLKSQKRKYDEFLGEFGKCLDCE